LSEYKFNLIPKKVKTIKTKNRRIITKIPPEYTVKILNELRKYEPKSMSTELPVLWNHAKGHQVFDSSGNIWIDFSSGIFVANVGHGHPKIKKAILEITKKPLLHNYFFPSEIRAKLVKKLISMTPKYLNNVFLLTTGTEAIECAIKIIRTYGKNNKQSKVGILSFDNSMHGKTLGALMVGGKKNMKTWISHHDPDIFHLPFPHYSTCPFAKNEEHICDDSCFEKVIKELGRKINLTNISGIMIETYQGWGALFFPKLYIQALDKWAKKNGCLLVFDEIQAGFGRTGKLFAYEHYNVKPDIVCCGKGLSSSLPLSAVLSKRKLLDLDSSLNSTHGGNPICVAATLASLEIIEEDNLISESDRKGKIVEKKLKELQKNNKKIIKEIAGKGLVWAIHIMNPITKELDSKTGDVILEEAMKNGVLMVRTSSGTLKIGPPLSIPDNALIEGLEVLDKIITKINQDVQ
jgi:4-aminobutyrate aminotransferase / (S)-3-amino-2-methylpropionate transaminase / 5-aminovalerate transaminase